LINSAKTVQGSEQATSGGVVSNMNVVKCEFDLTRPHLQPGSYDVIVTDSAGRQVKMADAITLA
jgi:hypothetical protein